MTNFANGAQQIVNNLHVKEKENCGCVESEKKYNVAQYNKCVHCSANIQVARQM